MIGLALFVYKRPELTKRVIESLKANSFEKIYVFQDGLKNDTDKEQWKEVSKLIRKIDFAKTEIHIANKNKGLANSIIDGLNYVFERHETAIALEDDVILSSGFKSFVEALFEKYAENKKVISICGGGFGTVVPEDYTYDIYFSCRMSSVAFGTWKDRWTGFERNPLLIKEIYSDVQKKKIYDYAGNDIERMLFDSLRNKNDTWATYWGLYQINQYGYHIIPVKGYAIDIGRRGGGTNTKTCITRYDIELDGEKKEIYNLPNDIIFNSLIMEDTKDLMDVADNKFQNYFDILCDWMRLYQKNLSVVSYFIENEIDRIYIYGMGNLAEFLYHDIFEKIEIAGYVVENRRMKEYKGKKVFDMKNFIGMEDIPIVITPSYDITFIRHFFRKCKIKNRVILIDYIIEYVLNKEKILNDR